MRRSPSDVIATLALSTALAVGACRMSGAPGGKSSSPGGQPPAEAIRIFGERCAVCHGASGRGDGPGSAALSPKPRNYTDKTWQFSVTDDQIRRTIIVGGAGVGRSPAMPASPDLEGKSEVVNGLVQIIRGFGQ